MITGEICRRDLRVDEVPISYYGRTYDEGKGITLARRFPCRLRPVPHTAPAASRDARRRAALSRGRPGPGRVELPRPVCRAGRAGAGSRPAARFSRIDDDARHVVVAHEVPERRRRDGEVENIRFTPRWFSKAGGMFPSTYPPASRSRSRIRPPAIPRRRQGRPTGGRAMKSRPGGTDGHARQRRRRIRGR